MNTGHDQVELRLSLIACSAQDAHILTTLDAGHRVRKLPTLVCDPGLFANMEQAVRHHLGPALRASLQHLEQIHTSFENGQLTIDMLGLVKTREAFCMDACDWWSVYELFPWEDWRKRPPEAVSHTLLPALDRWAGQLPKKMQQARTNQIKQLFASADQKWISENLAQRYELLYRAELLPEALRDRSGAAVSVRHHLIRVFGQTMWGPDRQQLARALSKLRQSLQNRPWLMALMPGPFSLGDLQKSLENLTGIGLHKQNFRRDILRSGLIEPLDVPAASSGGRPAQIYTWQNSLNPQVSNIGLPMPRRKI